METMREPSSLKAVARNHSRGLGRTPAIVLVRSAVACLLLLALPDDVRGNASDSPEKSPAACSQVNYATPASTSTHESDALGLGGSARESSRAYK